MHALTMNAVYQCLKRPLQLDLKLSSQVFVLAAGQLVDGSTALHPYS